MQFSKGITTALTLILLALPGAALADGGAAGDQYTEQIPQAGPGSSGDIDGSSGGTGGSASGGGTGSGGALGSATNNKFDMGGADGKAAANLSASSAPDSDALNSAAAEAQSGTPSSTSVFDSPGDSSSSDDGMGIALPIILAIVLLGGLSYAWKRRRGDSGTTGGSTGSSLRDRFVSSLPGRG